MRKIFRNVMAIIMITMTTLASSTGKTMGETFNVPLQRKQSSKPAGRPRAPELILFTACMDTDLGALFISSEYDVNEVMACVENLSTGEYAVYSFDSSETAMT